MDDNFIVAANWIKNAEKLVISAGAGMGVDSGMPDFRGNNGFWKTYPALAKANINFQTIANPASFNSHPRLAWGFYGHRLNLYRQLTPHKGFQHLLSWINIQQLPHFVFTSNVDGHFQKAGFAESSLYECHGSIHYLQCINNCQKRLWPAEGFNPAIDEESGLLLNDLPTCHDCGALARPAILMFGDWGWNSKRSDEQYHHMQAWLKHSGRTVTIEIGAGTAIPSVRHFGEQLCQNTQNKLIRINPGESNINYSIGIGLASGGLTALEKMNDLLTSYT